jgi:large conductance mechanosensitive channel
MSFIQEFKSFALKGNVMDLAVGVIIGAAFGKIVDSLVADMIMPLVSLVFGGLDFANYYLPLAGQAGSLPLAEAKKLGAVFAYGSFVTMKATERKDVILLALGVDGIEKLARDARGKAALAEELVRRLRGELVKAEESADVDVGGPPELDAGNDAREMIVEQDEVGSLSGDVGARGPHGVADVVIADPVTHLHILHIRHRRVRAHVLLDVSVQAALADAREVLRAGLRHRVRISAMFGYVAVFICSPVVDKSTDV